MYKNQCVVLCLLLLSSVWCCLCVSLFNVVFYMLIYVASLQESRSIMNEGMSELINGRM